MVDAKKPVTPAPSTPVGKPTTNTATRPSSPSLSPLPGDKPAAPNVQAGTPATDTAATVKAAQPSSTETQANAAPVSKPASTETKPTAAPASSAKAEEKLGPKLRKRDEILQALRGGAHIERIDGLYRIVHANGTKNATSKRRIISLQTQKLLIVSGDGKMLTLDKEADAKAREPRAAAAPSTAKQESSTGTKPEEAK